MSRSVWIAAVAIAFVGGASVVLLFSQPEPQYHLDVQSTRDEQLREAVRGTAAPPERLQQTASQGAVEDSPGARGDPPFDLHAALAASLDAARLGAPEAQYRAAVLLRACRHAQMTEADFEKLARADLTTEQLADMRQRVQECAAARSLVEGDISIESARWFEAALRQKYPLAVAEHLCATTTTTAPLELDQALKAGLAAAGGDAVLRAEAFFLVLSAMDKRSATNGIDADPVVRNAWMILHCRAAHACDLPATIEHLRAVLAPIDLQLAMDLARHIDVELKAGNWSALRLH